MIGSGLKVTLLAAALALAPACSDDDGSKGVDGGKVLDFATVDQGSAEAGQVDRGASADKGATADKGAPQLDFGAAPRPWACVRSCKVDDDCCKNPPCKVAFLSMSCVKGQCKAAGCTTDKDCPGMACATLKLSSTYSHGVCGVYCDSDKDCSGTDVCGQVEINVSRKACAPSCKKDTDCKTKHYCKEGKYCVHRHKWCKKDVDCTINATLGHDKCDVATGLCGCSSTAFCKASIGAWGGTYQCRSYPF